MKIVSSAIILENKKILLIKRSDDEKAFPGYWAGPGGKANEGETPEQAVTREAKEETNLEFKPKELIKIGQYMDRPLYRFYGDWSGDVKIQEEEIADWKWYSYDEAIKLKLAFDWREVIEILCKRNLL